LSPGLKFLQEKKARRHKRSNKKKIENISYLDVFNSRVLFRFMWVIINKYSGMVSLPFRFFTPFLHHSIQSTKFKYLNSWGKSCVFSESTGLSLNILGVRLRRIPSKSDSGRLNLQSRFIHPQIFTYDVSRNV